jgi:ParB family chromosome partitioning protein
MPADTFVEMIPLSKLVPSPSNVRKTGRDLGIEELAASIAGHGLLQNLTVRPVLDAERNETGKYEVVAGSRRFAALKLLAKRKVILKNYPVPCAVMTAFSGEEVSLAENIFQAPMHPADQYEAFAKLHTQEGQSAEDIAARFGVTPTVVKQRLRLGAVSPVLMDIYRQGEMTLEQLMAFTITDDHALQERVWKELTWNKSKEMIRRLLVEGHIEATDRRALYIAIDAYEAAGGHVVRDLFDAEHEGYFDDPELLHRLVAEKLDREADPIRAEGWKWVLVAPEFHYSAASGMRRVFPEAVSLTDEDQAKLDAARTSMRRPSLQRFPKRS